MQHAGHDDVVSIFPDSILELHTTRSWDFLEAESGRLPSNKYQRGLSSDVIIGMIDTGNNPHPSSTSQLTLFIYFVVKGVGLGLDNI